MGVKDYGPAKSLQSRVGSNLSLDAEITVQQLENSNDSRLFESNKTSRFLSEA